MADTARLTDRDVAERLRTLGQTSFGPRRLTRGRMPDAELSAEQWAYRQAAAVLSYFDPRQIQPFGTTATAGGGLPNLIADSIPAGFTDDRLRWILKADVRKVALARLGSVTKVKEALEVNPVRSDDPLQQAFEAVVMGKLKAIEALNVDELSSTLQVLEWLGDLAADVKGLPSRDDVRLRLQRESLLRPFRQLVGTHFRGRRDELQRLRDYVGVHRPSSAVAGAARVVREIFSLHERPPVLIHGPGGMGKSTLIAKFILDHQDTYQEFPFVYIDFDRPNIVAEEPLTILIEAARQLSTQNLAARERWQQLSVSWAERVQGLTEIRESIVQENADVQPATVGDRSAFLDEMRGTLAMSGVDKRPFLLVLDTFEEVQYRSREFVGELWEFLDQLQTRIPRLRTVIAGRVPVPEFHTEDLELEALDLEAATGYVLALGITDAHLAREVAEHIGGNPLSLRLATEVLRRTGNDRSEIESVQTRRFFSLFEVQQETIQGRLYRRILEHIHDPDVRRLAHPGLLLRRITPEIIKDVLAEPCGVAVPDMNRAQQLFDEFAREITLVAPAEDGSLRHRPDIRKTMVLLLNQDKREQATVAKIHQNAIRFYSSRTDVASRAEEIYHRLASGEEPSEVNARWMPGVEEQLRAAIDELPPRAQAFLASRVGVELDPKVWEKASQEDWERQAERRVRDLLRLDNPKRALEVLDDRNEPRTPGSQLYSLEAEAAGRVGDNGRARKALQDGLAAAATSGESPAMLRLLIELATLDTREKREGEASAGLGRAFDLAVQLRDDLKTLEVAALLFQLRPDLVPAKDKIDTARAAWTNVPDNDLADRSALVTAVAWRLGQDDPAVVRRALRLTGFPLSAFQSPSFRPGSTPHPSPTERRAMLAQAFDAWDRELAVNPAPDVATPARLIGVNPGENSLDAWTAFVNSETDPSRLRRVLELLVNQLPLTPNATTLLAWAGRPTTADSPS